MQHRYKREKGAVTVFCVIVLFTMVLLGGIFIDGTRILLAKQMVRASMNSAARSALSYYDEGLTGDFGLYGVTEENATNAFKHYFEKNLTLSQNDGFNLYKFDMGDDPVSVTVSEPLSDNEVLKDQINEFQKYRAGVNLAIGTTEKLKGLFGKGSAGEASRDVVNNADNALESLKNSAKELGNTINSTFKSAMDTQIKKAKKEVLEAAEKDGLDIAGIDLGEKGFQAVFGDMNKSILESEKDKEKYKSENEKNNKKMESASDAMNSIQVVDEETGKDITVKADRDKRNVGEDENSPLKQAETIISAAKSQITKTEDVVNSNLSKVRSDLYSIQEKKKAVADLESKIKELEASTKKSAELDKLEKDMKNAESDYNAYKKYPVDYETYISNLTNDISKLKDELEDLKKKYGESNKKVTAKAESIEELEQKLSDVTAEQNAETALKKRYDNAKAAYDKVNKPYLQKLSELNKLKSQKNTLESEIEGLKEDIERQYDGMAVTEKIKSDINYDIEASDEEEEEANNAFKNIRELLTQKLEVISEPMKKASTPGQDPGIGSVSLSDLKSPGGSGLIDTVRDTLDGLVDICNDPSGILDRLYYVDYTMDRFTFLTSHTSYPSHWFQIGEVEYIYNGADMQVTNNIAVLGKIIMIRLAIDFADDFVNTHSPDIVFRAGIALGRALVHMSKDMLNLIVNGQCDLSPSFKNVQLKYSDHLRLMLLLDVVGRNGLREKLNRTKVMINDTLYEKKTVELSQLYTRVSATSNVRINLIMLTLPMFEPVMAGNDTIKDGTFLIKEKVSMGY